MTTATQEGAATEIPSDWSEHDAGEELLQRFLRSTDKDAEKPSTGEQEPEEKPTPKPAADDDKSAEKPDQSDEGDEQEDDEGDEEADDKGKEKKFANEEGTYVKIKVGDEEHEVPVAKLTRLYGQEAALTKKSMEVAELRKANDAEQAKNVAATQALLTQAKQRFEPFSKLDFNLLATQLDPQEYTALRDSARAAYEEMAFLENHLDGFMKELNERGANQMRQRATEALTVLNGPVEKGGIEGFNQKLYDEVRSFALSYGIPAEAVNNAVDPWAIRLMHDAMLFARGKKGNVVTKKVNKGPKKITKTTNSPAAERDDPRGRSTDNSKLMNRLRDTGSTDDAAELLLSRWRKSSDD